MKISKGRHENLWSAKRKKNRMNAASSDFGYQVGQQAARYRKANDAITRLYERWGSGSLSVDEFLTKVSHHIASLRK